MCRAVGVDPGTKSIDICAIEEGKVYYEKSIDNIEIAKNPEIIMNAIKETEPFDLIAGPSGMGVKLTRIEEIPDEIFEDWYYRYILLTTKEEILKAIEEGVFGALIYKNMTELCVSLKKEHLPVIFIPSVILLPTVPYYRKINKIDMGTADKMAVSLLGIYNQSKQLQITYSEVAFILVEIGFGYNAVIGVEKGVIVDGIGGTTFPGIGFLTASAMDFDLVQIVHNWNKKDIFEGGVVSITNEMDYEKFAKNKGIAFQSMMEGIEKAVSCMKVSVKEPKEILISGRLTKVKEIKEELIRRLSHYAKVNEVEFLEGAKITKETAQGYAIVADGVGGGKFKELIEWTKIKECKGTILDYVYHPKIKEIKFK